MTPIKKLIQAIQNASTKTQNFREYVSCDSKTGEYLDHQDLLTQIQVKLTQGMPFAIYFNTDDAHAEIEHHTEPYWEELINDPQNICLNNITTFPIYLVID